MREDRSAAKLRHEVYHSLLAWCDGEMSPQDADRLAQLIRESEEARRHYLDFTSDWLAIRDLASSLSPQAAAAKSPTGTSKGLDAPPRNSRRVAVGVPFRFLRSTGDVIFHPIMLVLLVGFVSAGVLAYQFWSSPQPVARGPLVNPALSPAAAISGSKDAQWHPQFSPANNELFAGKRLKLTSGLAKITFESQATVILEGPAELTISDRNACRLSNGKLAASVPRSAIGFTVHTADAKIVDLGTEFGVWVRGEGSGVRGQGSENPKSQIPNPKSEIASTEVHVFQGWVAAVKLDAAGARQSRPIDVGAGQAVRIDVQSNESPQITTSDPKKFVRSLDEPRPLQIGDIIVHDAENEGTLRGLSGSEVIASGHRSHLAGPLAFAPDGQHFYTFARIHHNRLCRLLRITASLPGAVVVVADGLRAPLSSSDSLGLAVEPDGSVLAGSMEVRDIDGQRKAWGTIVRIDVRQQNVWKTVVTNLPGLAGWIAIAPGGETYVAVQATPTINLKLESDDQKSSFGYIARLDRQSGVMTPWIRDINPSGLIVEPANGDLWVAHRLPNDETEIRRYRSDGKDQGRVTLFNKLNPRGIPGRDGLLAQLRQLAWQQDGALLAAFDHGGGLWRVDLGSGKQTRIHDQGDLRGVGVVPGGKK